MNAQKRKEPIVDDTATTSHKKGVAEKDTDAKKKSLRERHFIFSSELYKKGNYRDIFIYVDTFILQRAHDTFTNYLIKNPHLKKSYIASYAIQHCIHNRPTVTQKEVEDIVQRPIEMLRKEKKRQVSTTITRKTKHALIEWYKKNNHIPAHVLLSIVFLEYIQKKELEETIARYILNNQKKYADILTRIPDSCKGGTV